MSTPVDSIRVDSSRADTLHDLIASVGGSVHLPGAEDCADSRGLWKSAVNRKPALVVKCRSVDEVRLAVRAGRLRNFALSVRGGGHDWTARARAQDGLVIDLSAMRRVNVDPITQVATVEGGATAADVIRAASQYGLVAVTANVGAVGMAGLTLGGGYGALTPKFGLALDNLLGADVVLEDGSLVTTDSTNNGELFWALRGGGGKFGIVVSMRIRLHALSELLSSIILFPWSQARSVLHGYAALMSCAPDELSVLAGVLPTPEGEPAVLVAPVWAGDMVRGRKAIADFAGLGTPLFSNVGPTTYADMVSMYDSHVVHGRSYSMQTRWLPELASESLTPLIEFGGARTSPASVILLHHFHGAGTRISTPATAFGLRRRHFMVEIVASWEDSPNDNGAAHRRWARDLSAALEPVSIPGGYTNLLAPDAYEQVDAAYGCNALRLRRLKRRFDPDGVFSSATPIPG
jgi:FAD/FMN-containing dehydrogenase